MISRRNIRVKVMQTIYILATRDQLKPDEAVKLLTKHFEQSKDLFVYIIHFLCEIAAYAEKDAYRKSSKHLPSAADLAINTKISGNEVIWKIREDAGFQQQQGKSNPDSRLDRELVKKIYQNLAASNEYISYITKPERTFKEERSILEFLFNDLMLGDDIFTGHLEELFMNWDDDADMVIQLVKSLLQKPSNNSFNEVISPDKWLFAKTLLNTVLDKKEHLEELIFPRLKNWDAERIASLDMIIMKMGVAELLYFDTIPPKVTINEYIDIAKEYSTAQSGQFVNGILDNIHKDLAAEGKLHKTDFKKA